MIPYVPVPTKLPASINQPQDIVDNVVVATVNPQDQILANGVAWQEHLREFNVRFSLTTQTVLTGGYVAFDTTPEGGSGHFAVSGPGDKEIHVGAVGIYQVFLTGFFRSGGVLNPQLIKLDLDAGALGTFQVLAESRWTNSVSDPVTLTGSGIVEITNTATQFLQIFNPNPDSIGVSTSDGLSRISIVRLQ